jgi:hypothetical protein
MKRNRFTTDRVVGADSFLTPPEYQKVTILRANTVRPYGIRPPHVGANCVRPFGRSAGMGSSNFLQLRIREANCVIKIVQHWTLLVTCAGRYRH